MNLSGKLFIKGIIEVKTGISIGGSKTDTDIGGIDNSVIRDSQGVPYIPGSSIKGKMRSLLERTDMEGITSRGGKSEKEKETYICKCGKCDICAIFGVSADKEEVPVGPTRLYVRDAMLTEQTKTKMENHQGIFSNLELTYTEGKWENTIDRKTSMANPRQLERVPAGAQFEFNMVYNIYQGQKDIDRFKQLIKAMRMLEDDYLGGNGSRGYGRIKFIDVKIGLKNKDIYEGDNEIKNIFEGNFDDFSMDNLSQVNALV